MTGADEWSSLARQTEFRELLARLDLEERAARWTIRGETRDDWNRRALLTRCLIVERLRAVDAQGSVPAELGEWLTTLERYETAEQGSVEQGSVAESLRALIVARLMRAVAS